MYFLINISFFIVAPFLEDWLNALKEAWRKLQSYPIIMQLKNKVQTLFQTVGTCGQLLRAGYVFYDVRVAEIMCKNLFYFIFEVFKTNGVNNWCAYVNSTIENSM